MIKNHPNKFKSPTVVRTINHLINKLYPIQMFILYDIRVHEPNLLINDTLINVSYIIIYLGYELFNIFDV